MFALIDIPSENTVARRYSQKYQFCTEGTQLKSDFPLSINFARNDMFRKKGQKYFWKIILL